MEFLNMDGIGIAGTRVNDSGKEVKDASKT